MNLLKLLIAMFFGKKEPKLHGSILFPNEYESSSQYTTINKLFGKEEKPIIRLPFEDCLTQTFVQAAKWAGQKEIEVLALIGDYGSHDKVMNRLNAIKSQASFIKYIELFNELPHMNDLYPGEKITSLQMLLEKTNEYTTWIHQNLPGVKVVTMAPYNSMDERSWQVWDNVTNTRILKELILYTVADISAIHLYGDSLGKKLQLVELASDIKKWNKETKYPKKIWVTECGEEPWKNQVSYYDKIVKLFRNTVDPEKIIWYRQCVKKSIEQDNGYALETIDNLQVSPLYNKLKDQ